MESCMWEKDLQYLADKVLICIICKSIYKLKKKKQAKRQMTQLKTSQSYQLAIHRQGNPNGQ